MTKDVLDSVWWKWRDWLASEARATMSLEARGAYRDLLDHHYGSEDCTLPADETALARLAGCTPSEWKRIRAQVLPYLPEVDGKPGRRQNAKAAAVWGESMAIRQQRRTAGSAGGSETAKRRRSAAAPTLQREAQQPAAAAVQPLSVSSLVEPSALPRERKAAPPPPKGSAPINPEKRTESEPEPLDSEAQAATEGTWSVREVADLAEAAREAAGAEDGPEARERWKATVNCLAAAGAPPRAVRQAITALAGRLPADTQTAFGMLRESLAHLLHRSPASAGR